MKKLKIPIKEELILHSITLAVMYCIAQIAFYKESPLIVISTVLALFGLFTLPGSLVLFTWRKNLHSVERIIVGTLLGGAFFIITAYHLGLMGLNIQIATFFVPGVLYIIAGAIAFYSWRNHEKK